MNIEFNAFRSIYPLIIWDRSKGCEPGCFHFCGTGFFMLFNKIPMIVTARHVLEELTENSNARLLLSERYGKIGNPILINGAVIWKKSEDFGAFMPIGPVFERFIEAPIALPLCRDQLTPYRDVYTFGFPFNTIESPLQDYDGPQEFVANIQHAYLKGYIVTDRGSEFVLGNTKFDSNYLLNFPSYPGLSGAPLMTVKNNQMYVSGIIYANSSSRQKGVEADFALASTYRIIDELESHIRDATKRR